MLLAASAHGIQPIEGHKPHLTGTVLLIEDEPDVAALLSLVLIREGDQVERVASAAAAHTALARTQPNLIVMDITLPDADGVVLCTQLRTDVRTATIPIVVITGYAEPSICAAAYAAGAAVVLIKPFQIDDFRAAVRAQLAAATKEKAND